MKKYLLSLLLSLIIICSFNSCTIDNGIELPNNGCPQIVQIFLGEWTPGTMNSNGQYVIGGYTTGQTRSAITKAAVSQTYDDKFSLYAWTPDSTVMNNYHGVFGTDPNNNLPSWGYTEDIKYFDNFVSEYNFIGIIPQSDSHIYNPTNHTVTVSADTFSVSSTDLAYKDDREILYATTTVQKANYANGASLVFNNLNSKIYLQFTSDDANTQILDFTPYTPGVPAQAAYDEVIDVTTYSMTATTVPTLGPLVTAIDIADEDMDFVNSKYTASKGFSSYQSNNTISGNLDENMWEYLLNKYHSLSSINLANWSTYTSNANMRLVHIDKTGHTSVDNDSYKAVWVNVQSVNWNAGTTTQQVIHHDAVPEVPATGQRGIIMLPATSSNGTGTDAVLSTFPTSVNATISLSGVNWQILSTGNSITFNKPNENVYTNPVQAPMTFFTFPASVANTSNLGYTIKFSYNYKGVNVYDARVYIPTSKCNWQSAKYYVYQIHISNRGNGKSDPSEADPTDPTIPSEITNYQITINSVSITGYTNETWTWDSENGWH